MDFGFVGNSATLRDVPELARHVAAAYEDLKAEASKRRSAKSRARKPRETSAEE
jgi:hypothetical protein